MNGNNAIRAVQDLVATLIDIVREEQKMRADLQTRVFALEQKKPGVLVEMPRLNEAQAPDGAKEN